MRCLRPLPKTPEAKVSRGSQVVHSSEITSSTFGCFRRFSASSAPSHPRPAKGSASSDNSNRPSLSLLPQGLPALICRPYPSNPLLLTSLTVLVFSTSRGFPALRPQTPPEIMLDSKFRLFPEIPLAHSSPLAELRLLPPPLRKGPTHRDSFGFFRLFFGSFRLGEQKREGGRRRGGSREGIRGRGGVPAPDSWLSGWGE